MGSQEKAGRWVPRFVGFVEFIGLPRLFGCHGYLGLLGYHCLLGCLGVNLAEWLMADIRLVKSNIKMALNLGGCAFRDEKELDELFSASKRVIFMASDSTQRTQQTQ